MYWLPMPPRIAKQWSVITTFNQGNLAATKTGKESSQQLKINIGSFQV
jgi:hypothetical protein